MYIDSTRHPFLFDNNLLGDLSRSLPIDVFDLILTFHPFHSAALSCLPSDRQAVRQGRRKNEGLIDCNAGASSTNSITIISRRENRQTCNLSFVANRSYGRNNKHDRNGEIHIYTHMKTLHPSPLCFSLQLLERFHHVPLCTTQCPACLVMITSSSIEQQVGLGISHLVLGHDLHCVVIAT